MAQPQLQVLSQKLTRLNEETWILAGSLAQQLDQPDFAIFAYETALRHNPYSIPALTEAATMCKGREIHQKAATYFERILHIDENKGEIWGALGHCYLMMDNLQKAYTAYQQALDKLPNAMEPGLWYGIGILYDKYGSYKVAEEAFAAVLKMDPNFEKANEIYYRLGFIYMQQAKYDLSLQCFEYIQNCPPKPLTKIDIWLKIGHVHEQQKEYTLARSDYERVLKEVPNHAKGLQHLGWLYHIDGTSFRNPELAISFLTRSSESDPDDAFTFYQLGRCYMAQGKHTKAYEAYQKAVFKDEKDPRFWCSIGVLYFQIGQAKDALDAYIRAISFDSHISEVWFNLGILYESCNNQMNDAIDAFSRALELDPGNAQIKARLDALTRQHGKR
ncbi:glucose repression mediator protein [Nowakowskiella sp. JEL0407]|nr:glucose repression mediator protein [Nowakowskiella sp. JEL0407]